jgi:uncharacterized membrane protein YheB (UPF0754 family)
LIRQALDLVRRHLPASDPVTGGVRIPATLPPSAGTIRPSGSWMKWSPVLLSALFMFSFRYDYDGLVRILSVSGLIGYGTNWLAITMLFRPRKKRPLLGWGLIPANKERIAMSLAGAVSRNLVNPDLIRKRLVDSKILTTYLDSLADQTTGILRSSAFRSDLDRLILDEIRTWVGSEQIRRQAAEALADALEDATSTSRLEHIAFKTYRKVRGDTFMDMIDHAMRTIPDHVEPHLIHLHRWLDSIPEETRRHSGDIEAHILDSLHRVLSDMDLSALIRDTVRAYDESRLEHLIQDATSDQLKTIQYLGAILGTLGGFLIWKPLWAIPVFAGLAAFVWGLDRVMGRKTTARAEPVGSSPPTSKRP